jgi:hypothetical protein
MLCDWLKHGFATLGFYYHRLAADKRGKCEPVFEQIVFFIQPLYFAVSQSRSIRGKLRRLYTHSLRF